MSSKSEIILKPSEDIHKSWITLDRGFGPVAPLLDELYPNRGTPEGDRQVAGRLIAKMKKDPGIICMDAMIDGEIAGSAFWQFMDTPIAQGLHDLEKDWETIWPEGDEREYFQQIWQDFVQPRRDVVMDAQLNGKKVLLLEYLAVNPNYRRRGVGEKLVSWGLEQADKQGLDSVLEATIDGGKLYRKLGFEDIGTIKFDSVTDKFESRTRPDLMFMRRPARPAST